MKEALPPPAGNYYLYTRHSCSVSFAVSRIGKISVPNSEGSARESLPLCHYLRTKIYF